MIIPNVCMQYFTEMVSIGFVSGLIVAYVLFIVYKNTKKEA